MKLTKKLFLGLSIGIGSLAMAQNTYPVLTGAPFLRISPDARAGGLGDQGVATSADAFSQFWNASKFPFSRNTSSAAVSYTPWMGKLTNDVFLLYLGFNTMLGEEDRSSLSASIYYFNMGEVDLTTLVAGTGEISSLGTAKPNEFAIDVAYALKLSDTYSMAVTGRYIRYLQTYKHTSFGDYEGRVRAGWAIQNLGPRLDYTGDENSRSYLPTTFRLGAGYDLFLDEVNKVGLTLEASKLLVPGPDETGNVPNVGVIEGIGKSFSNKESIMYSGSLEYSYDNAFSVRTGYFRESEIQGARQYTTVGVGLNYNSFGLDLSYLINTSKVNTALDNTLRFGLTWNIGEESYNNEDY